MDNGNANGNSEPPFSRPVPPTSPLRRVVQYGVAGALGGGVFALIQHLGPGFLTEPALVRWVFLYALLGGLGVSTWKEVTRWAAARVSLSRWGEIATSGLLAGTLLGAAVMLVATLTQGVGDGALLLALPWQDGLGGFVGGVIGGGLDRCFTS